MKSDGAFWRRTGGNVGNGDEIEFAVFSLERIADSDRNVQAKNVVAWNYGNPRLCDHFQTSFGSGLYYGARAWFRGIERGKIGHRHSHENKEQAERDDGP